MKWFSIIVVFSFTVILLILNIYVPTMVSLEKENFVFDEKNSKIKIEISKTANQKFNELLDQKITELKNKYLREIKDSILGNVNIKGCSYSFKKYLSYKFEIELYTGGAHPNTFFETFIYDTSLNKEIDLDDILKENPFFLEKVSQSIQSDLLLNPKIISALMMMENTLPKKENFSHFVLTDEGILFFFPPYQVAPYSSGTFSSLVSYQSVKP